ncbi:MAG: hypothetical protein U0P81_03585 [Holophagaceae bacterium]
MKLGAASAAPTVSLAAALAAEPWLLVATHRKEAPSSEAWTPPRARVAPVAPGRAVQAFPSGLRCHCRVGAGFPAAATVKLAAPPAGTLWSAGCRVKLGAASAAPTVSVATELVTEPAPLETTTS